MRIHCTADSARVEARENGFNLVIDTDEGATIIVRVHSVADELYESVQETIGSWRAERQNARASYSPPIDPAIFDARDGYSLNDPKLIALERETSR